MLASCCGSATGGGGWESSEEGICWPHAVDPPLEGEAGKALKREYVGLMLWIRHWRGRLGKL